MLLTVMDRRKTWDREFKECGVQVGRSRGSYKRTDKSIDRALTYRDLITNIIYNKDCTTVFVG